MPALARDFLTGCQRHNVPLQAYFIFSIGNIKPMLTFEYPECWKTYQECSKNLTNAPEYTQIIGAPSRPKQALILLRRPPLWAMLWVYLLIHT